MSDDTNAFLNAIAEKDPAKIRELMAKAEFVLISMSDGNEDEDDDGGGALTAEIDGHEALVIFTSEELAGQFVNEQEDLFEDTEEVEGLVVEGEALLEYLPEGFGMLIDPEFESSEMIEPELAALIVAAQG
ncbi:SseB family protein [Rubripirellula amarantea]|uniref:SseB protein N-terminal domain-containing protein n=1 Tax=Rubripirellula amarantea TaxID=2527999 RepID=A0A5C5WUX3_9BACT|nr:SseB family protein [Rubripirellula amarantea]MDA8744669.1 SseB family protein [Rubripirellula amarantea]TWT54408.1 hypothetical protein Pla22_20550 [Rubripirellula amarantea]